MHLLSLLGLVLLGAVPTLSVDYKKKFEEAEKTGGLTPLERQIVLNAHNHYRREVAHGKYFNQPTAAGMTLMMWDDRLADMALDWAVKLRNMDEFEHSPSRPNLDWHVVGENIGAFGKNSRNFLTLVGAFYKEAEFYNFTGDSCKTANPPNGAGTCGHYEQGIQAQTNYVGCQTQFHAKKNSLMFVCNFGVGRIKGWPYETGEPCSNCHWQATWCIDGMCVNEEVCEKTKNCECKNKCTNGAKIDDKHCVCTKDCPAGKNCYVKRKYPTKPNAVNVFNLSPVPDADCADVQNEDLCGGKEVYGYCFGSTIPYAVTCMRTCNSCFLKNLPKKDWLKGDECAEALDGDNCEQEYVKLLCWDTCKKYKKKS